MYIGSSLIRLYREGWANGIIMPVFICLSNIFWTTWRIFMKPGANITALVELSQFFSSMPFVIPVWLPFEYSSKAFKVCEVRVLQKVVWHPRVWDLLHMNGLIEWAPANLLREDRDTTPFQKGFFLLLLEIFLTLSEGQRQKNMVLSFDFRWGKNFVKCGTTWFVSLCWALNLLYKSRPSDQCTNTIWNTRYLEKSVECWYGW